LADNLHHQEAENQALYKMIIVQVWQKGEATGDRQVYGWKDLTIRRQ
jgi:hypothetical protein